MMDENIIQLKNVHKNFSLGEKEIPILKGISLDVAPGEFLAIVGPSGNGKSTLLNMITGIDRPTSGEVMVLGEKIQTMSEEGLAIFRGKNVGIVFQFFQLLPALTILQNVILPMDLTGIIPAKARKERAYELLEMVGLKDQALKLPSAVSGGQQQRAAIARALANDPPLLVADEPTGNLDARTSDEVFGLFSCLVDTGKTLMMVTHNEELANQIPRVIEVVNGMILFDSQRSVKMAAKMSQGEAR
jgi:putative ABC transport system ATP-binding protein